MHANDSLNRTVSAHSEFTPDIPAHPSRMQAGMIDITAMKVPESLVSTFREAGCIEVELPSTTNSRIEELFRLGPPFFNQSTETKQALRIPEIIEGIRFIGEEYDSPEMPTLNESFSMWVRNRNLPEVAQWRKEHAFCRQLHELLDDYCAIAKDVIGRIMREINPSGIAPGVTRMSYLQLNYYEPTKHKGEILQHRHEDGHLITILKATVPGLQIEVKGEWVDAPLTPGKVIVMPGSILTAMTGGLIEPGYHRVLPSSHPVRQSLMFFLNPDLDAPVEPWVRNESNRDVDIRQLTISNSTAFGLPSIISDQLQT